MEGTAKGFFETLASRLEADPGALAGLDCVFQFDIGEQRYNVTVRGGKATVAQGSAADPGCVVTMAEQTLADLLAGRINAQMAFLTGKVKVGGDMGLALKLGSILKA